MLLHNISFDVFCLCVIAMSAMLLKSKEFLNVARKNNHKTQPHLVTGCGGRYELGEEGRAQAEGSRTALHVACVRRY